MIRVFDDYESLSKNAASIIYNKGKEYIKTKHEFTLALAGGNTPKRTYQILADISKDDDVFWRNTKLYWTDERYVPHESPYSNYKMARDVMIEAVPILPDNVFPIPTQRQDVQQAADEYSAIFPDNIDVIILGMGTDGHIASIFPNGQAVKETEKRFTYDYAPVEPKLRITATIPTIKSANEIFVLVSGTSKRKALKQVFDESGEIEQIPARAVKSALWLVDKDAIE